jgi:hypothetical protein
MRDARGGCANHRFHITEAGAYLMLIPGAVTSRGKSSSCRATWALFACSPGESAAEAPYFVSVGLTEQGESMRRMIVLAPVLALGLMAVAPAAAAAGDNFVARLSGGQEVPTRDTQAVGVAKFKLREDGAALLFKVNVANIDNTVAAHIHCGDVGVNGPVGVTLFMADPAGGVTNGTLAEGTITAPDPGNGCEWTDMAAVLAAMQTGNTYVNVHTNDGVPPPNTGPGDFPGGEIRGQIR